VNLDQALKILKDNHTEWSTRGLQMVNVNDVEEAMRFLFDNTPYDWKGAIDAWERDRFMGNLRSSGIRGVD
jgi:hypothetical protein